MENNKNDPEAARLENLSILNEMIKMSAGRLDGLRTQCATSAEIVQQEIRTLEGKLVKLFSIQLVEKKKLTSENLPKQFLTIPSLELWLQVVGLTSDLIKQLCNRINNLESLKDRSEHEVKTILKDHRANDEEIRRLTRALSNLRRCIELTETQDSDVESSEFFWDSWDMQRVELTEPSRNHLRTRSSRSSVSGEQSNGSHSISPHSCVTTPCTPKTAVPPSSLNSPAFSSPSGSHNNLICSPTNSSVFSPTSPIDSSLTPPSTPPVKSKDKLTATPPAKKRLQAVTTSQSGNLHPDFPLTKSKSHESQLGNRVDYLSDSYLPADQAGRGKQRRPRLPTEPGPQGPSSSGWEYNSVGGCSSPAIPSPVMSPPSVYSENDDSESSSTATAKSLTVPKSPRTPTFPRSMGHVIQHRFAKTFKISTCDYCQKQLIIGLKCKDCKFKCHRDCEHKVPPSCGLPQEFISVFRTTMQQNDFNKPHPSPRKQDKKSLRPSLPPFSGHDSSSNTSSCNSSTPSSPAPFNGAVAPLPPTQFNFPAIASEISLDSHTISSMGSNDLTSTAKSNDSDRTVSQTSGSGSTDSEKTLAPRVDSMDSQISDGDPNDRVSWPRQNSLSNREWDIPFDELKMGEKLGTGHFGTVYRGNWHGDVAIKVLDMTYLDNEKTLEQFRQEVGIFRKTRHENLVLFMGACMKPPRLAIVTSMCKGNSLYTHLHLRKDKFNMNKTVLVAQQISQGMGYLHARGIIHKDLKSRNVFLESGKVVITDFGLFNVTKLCHGSRHGDCLSIPPGWLPYLAPEIMKALKVSQKNDNDLPFSKASDLYAFGTVWYELLCGQWPYKGLPPEAIIWQVGSGIRQPLPTLFSRDVKEILLMCWASRPEDRQDFTRLLKTLEKLPKKRLARSPSHPIHLSRSAESVF